MSVQDLVTTAGPWVAAGGGVLTAMTALTRSVGMRRLQVDIAKTARLLKDLPEDGAQQAHAELEAALAIQAARLHVRARDGRTMTRRQMNVVIGGVGVVANLATIGLLVLARETGTMSRSGADLVAFRILWTMGGIALGASLLVLFGGAIGAFESWIDDRTRRYSRGRRLVGDWIADLPILILLGPVLLVRAGLRRWGKQTDPPSAEEI